MAELEKSNDLIYRHSLALINQEINVSQDKFIEDRNDDLKVGDSSLTSSSTDNIGFSEQKLPIRAGCS
jgi:hypothetical protein